jgi:hypothetical protein
MTPSLFSLGLVPVLPGVQVSPSLRDPQDFVVFAFSQFDIDGEDPQVFELKPDVTICAIAKNGILLIELLM